MEKANKPEIPYFNNFEKSLLSHYAKLNINLNYQIFESSKSKPKQPRRISLKYGESAELREKCFKILELFKHTLEDRIITLTPSTPIYNSEKVNFLALNKCFNVIIGIGLPEN